MGVDAIPIALLYGFVDSAKEKRCSELWKSIKYFRYLGTNLGTRRYCVKSQKKKVTKNVTCTCMYVGKKLIDNFNRIGNNTFLEK
jgi:hypothetical protein